ncbi:hypothetical protein [Gordonia sp. (in: high G+C Gram-positive bacteria)]|uniref:hypothetical protein n=1 Tax=Gordonia sp. (in: high G+C Gram-positive bacteria) TaxID=84139 RepID=UPI002613674F|nr:hypothetical protein [Gordonia sp. (in: high G+C Gram-positive bacteria)]HMS73694.1 hypothetical protein [Gordonia sp. (in: high G+C Gram-positive bacteria)]
MRPASSGIPGAYDNPTNLHDEQDRDFEVVRSDVEAKLYDVAVFHDVVLTFHLERVESLRARLATIDADYGAGIIDGLRHRSATDRVCVELEATEPKPSTQRTGSALGELLATGNPSAAFLDVGLMSQRAMIDTLCTVGCAEERGAERYSTPRWFRSSGANRQPIRCCSGRPSVASWP